MEKNLMIVDDDPYILITIRELFEPLGYQVYTVNDGKTCLFELKNGFKGVILMDIMMPIMSGWDTIKEIVSQELHDGNIISILTAKGEPDSEVEEFEPYIRDYIPKPFDSRELISTVADYFEK